MLESHQYAAPHNFSALFSEERKRHQAADQGSFPIQMSQCPTLIFLSSIQEGGRHPSREVRGTLCWCPSEWERCVITELQSESNKMTKWPLEGGGKRQIHFKTQTALWSYSLSLPDSQSQRNNWKQREWDSSLQFILKWAGHTMVLCIWLHFIEKISNCLYYLFIFLKKERVLDL